jgi:hypothetical protein
LLGEGFFSAFLRQGKLYRTILFVKGEQDNDTDCKDEKQTFPGQSDPTTPQEAA